MAALLSSPISSPFALMFPEVVTEILQRAERMSLPRAHFSPLSKGSTPLNSKRFAELRAQEEAEEQGE